MYIFRSTSRCIAVCWGYVDTQSLLNWSKILLKLSCFEPLFFFPCHGRNLKYYIYCLALYFISHKIQCSAWFQYYSELNQIYPFPTILTYCHKNDLVTLQFITAHTKVYHCIWSWSSSIPFWPSELTSLIPNLMLSSHLLFPLSREHFPRGFSLFPC